MKEELVCAECGSTDVECLMEGWFRPNDNWIQGDSALGEIVQTSCENCDQQGIELIAKSKWRGAA